MHFFFHPSSSKSIPLSFSLSNACGEFCTVQFGNHLSCFEGAILALHIDDDWMIPDQFPGSYSNAGMTLEGKPVQPLLTDTLSFLPTRPLIHSHVKAAQIWLPLHTSLHLIPSFNQSILGWLKLNLINLQHVLWETYLFVNCSFFFLPIQAPEQECLFITRRLIPPPCMSFNRQSLWWLFCTQLTFNPPSLPINQTHYLLVF